MQKIWGSRARVLKRLDRALANNAWLLAGPEAVVTVLPRVASDLSPLVINTKGKAQHIKSPWRFEGFGLEFAESWAVQESLTVRRLRT